jgi:hypothetical protein
MRKFKVGDLVKLNKFKHRERTGWTNGIIIKIYPSDAPPGTIDSIRMRLRIVWSNGKMYDLNEKHLELVSKCE